MPKRRETHTPTPVRFRSWYKRLDLVRHEAGLSWNDLAEIGGIENSSWTRIKKQSEAGESPDGVGVGVFARIAHRLSVNLDWLLLGVGPQYVEPDASGRRGGPELGTLREGVEERSQNGGPPDVPPAAKRTQSKR